LTDDYKPRARVRKSRGRWARAAAMALVISMSITLAAGASTERRVPTQAPCSSMKTVPGAHADGSLTLSASMGGLGCIDLSVTGAAASTISITEVMPAPLPAAPIATLPTLNGEASLTNGVTWVCDRRTRTFQATETLPDGSQQSASTSVTTPSCATRLSTSVPPRRLHRDGPVTLALTDRWGLGGIRARACLSDAPRRACRAVTVKPGRSATIVRLRLAGAGRPTLDVSDPYESVRLRLRVLGSRPVLLATGDSEMQVLDEFLASDLSGFGGARVIGDARQSTAISSPFFFDWPAHAFGQVAGEHPDIVAMFIGGNDGFRLGSANCCGPDWSREYAGRVAGMMHTYLQHGAASVYWFLIPTPSSEPFVQVVRAVNHGIIMAAARFREGVHVVDLRSTFSPGGRYINSLRHAGQTITVHEADGFHLSSSADVIVAHMFIDQLRHDGVLP
jgi:hypothetical protein